MTVTNSYTLTLASGVSNAVDIKDEVIVGLIAPATPGGTALTWQFSIDNSTFLTMKSSAGTTQGITIDATTSFFYDVSQTNIPIAAGRYVKIAVASGTDGKVFTLLTRKPQLN